MPLMDDVSIIKQTVNENKVTLSALINTVAESRINSLSASNDAKTALNAVNLLLADIAKIKQKLEVE